MLTEWEEPCSTKEAFSRRRILIAEIQEIQAQLGNSRGRRPNSRAKREEYFRWRSAAIWALTNKLQELRYLKSWIFDHDAYDEVREPETAMA